MDLSKIVAIGGKPGLFKLISQSKNGFIVENIEKKNRLSISQQQQVSLLENIAIYTYEDDIPLKDVFTLIAKKENVKECINPKEDKNKLREYMLSILPNYDEERVYDSDLKKLFRWYNILLESGEITAESIKEVEKQKEVNSSEE